MMSITIQGATYKNADKTLVDATVVLDDGTVIPLVDLNLALSGVFYPEAVAAWIAAGNTPGPYVPPPPPVPQSISDRQFFQQLAIEGIITQDDALASNAAVIPPPLLALINAMPDDQQFNAKMIISGATVYNRQDPLTIAIGAAYGWSDAQIDAFFTAAAAL